MLLVLVRAIIIEHIPCACVMSSLLACSLFIDLLLVLLCVPHVYTYPSVLRTILVLHRILRAAYRNRADMSAVMYNY